MINVVDTFDLRNVIVPFLLLEIRFRFKRMQPGESLEILWNDPSGMEDLLRVLPAAAYEIVSEGPMPEPQAGFRMKLVKTGHIPQA